MKTLVCIGLRLILRSFHQCSAPPATLAALGFHIVRVGLPPRRLLLACSLATADGGVGVLQRLFARELVGLLARLGLDLRCSFVEMRTRLELEGALLGFSISIA